MSVINSNGLCVEVNLPDAPEGEGLHTLPPYKQQMLFSVDEYPGCPQNWPRGSNTVSSYFLPVEPGKHLWLDFNANWQHAHHVAALLNVQGVNPITGPINNEKPSMKLEQYQKCPIHDEDFLANRYCEKCDYKWPAQNYITTASTPSGQFWVDGWRTDTGEIRGFLITSETMRGVAAQLIGEERVFAIGIVFYTSKSPKPEPPRVLRTRSLGGGYVTPQSMDSKFKMYSKSFEGTTLCCSASDEAVPAMFNESRSLSASPASEEVGAILDEDAAEETCEKLEIGAGARIQQELSYPDKLKVSDYNDEPTTTVYINYCTKEQFDKIIKQGKKPKNEGFLTGLHVGN